MDLEKILALTKNLSVLIIVTLTDNLVVFATLAESFFSTNYRLENMKETQ